MAPLEECKQVYDDLISRYRAAKQMLKECEIEIEVARMRDDADSFRRESHKRNDLKEELEELTPEIQRAVDARVFTYKESRKKLVVGRSSFLSRVFGG